MAVKLTLEIPEGVGPIDTAGLNRQLEGCGMTVTSVNQQITEADLEAPALKRFFKRHFGIPVRVNTGKGKAGWLNVWIQSERWKPGDPPEKRHALIYKHQFPPELGSLCMRTVYAGHEGLENQNWGGNISGHSISMKKSEWVKVLQSLVDDPIQR